MTPSSDAVLIVAPRGRDSDVTSRILTEAGIRTESLPDVQSLLGRILEDPGALLLTAEALTWDSAQLLGERLRRQPPWSDLPILLLGEKAPPDRRTLRIQALLQSASNITLLERPLQRSTLVSSIQVALRARRRQYEVRDFSATLERTVKERTASLEELVKTLRAFTYTVAHDLRGPIRNIHRYAELLLTDVTGENHDFAESIARAASGMDELIQALLSYSRLTRTEIQARVINVESLARQVLSQLDFELRERRAIVRIDGPLAPALGDEPMIGQILTNLISNGTKFVSPDVTPQLRIRSELRPQAGMTRFWVEDNGIGIDPAFHEKAFEVFERLSAAGRYPGTGIGLAIVRKAAELMGGRAGVESAPGQGSRFWFELPSDGRAV